ncbi:MAG: cytochrome c oxidase subunit II [Phycisphaerae bacterium]
MNTGSKLACAVVVYIASCGYAAPAATATVDEPTADAPVQVIDGDYGYGLPPDVSVNGHEIDELITVLHGFMIVLFVGWGIFLLTCLIRFRRSAGYRAVHEAVKAKPAKYIEIGVVGFEGVLLLGFSIPIWGNVKNNIPAQSEAPVRVHVLAEQFNWNFHYPGPDQVFGRTAPEHINPAANPIGLDPNDPKGEDDIVSGVLRIPVGRPVICELSSKDVIHSFFIPVMRIKQDTIPGMRIPVWFEAKTTGTYQVACAQLCGNNHYSMKALMVIETPDEFEAWLAAQNAPPEEFDEDEFED